MLTAPLNNAIVFVNTNVTVSANGSDSDGTVKKIEFFVGSTLIGVDSAAPYSITWKPTQTGIYAVLAKSIDNDNKFTFADANVVEVKSTATGIKEKTNEQESIVLYPNPANEKVYIKTLFAGPIQLDFFDISGRKVKYIQSSTAVTTVAIADINAGIYFVKTTCADGTVKINKLIIERK